MRFRVDVGIDPYIETGGASRSTCSSISVRFGRLVAAPTGAPDWVPFYEQEWRAHGFFRKTVTGRVRAKKDS